MKYIVLSLILLYTNIYSQSDIPVSQYLNEIASGNSDKVKLILPDLMVEYPNDPGVKLLTASVLTDAMKSLKIYNEIVNESPQSQWADDALYRIIQFHVVLSNGEEALSELNKLRQRYPTSQYIIPSADLVKTFIGVNGNLKAPNYSNLNKDNDRNIIETEKVIINNKPKVKQENKSTNSDIIILQNNKSAVKQPIDTRELTPMEQDLTPQNQVEQKPKELVPEQIEINKSNNIGNELTNSDNIAKVEDQNEYGKDETSNSTYSKNNDDNAEQLKQILNKQMDLEKKVLEERKALEENENQEINQSNTIAKSDEVKQKSNNKQTDLAINNQEINQSEDAPKIRWGLQVAIFDSKDKAEKEKEKFISQRMRTEVVTKLVDNTPMYAVVVGNYSTKANAEAAKIIINQQCNCNPIILER